MGCFCYSGVALKITEEIENLIIEEYVKENGPLDDYVDKDDIISETISNVGGVKFWPDNDYGRKTPISNEGRIVHSGSEEMVDYENYLWLPLDCGDLSKPWLEKNQTLKDVVLNCEEFTFIPKDCKFKSKLEFYWLDIAEWND